MPLPPWLDIRPEQFVHAMQAGTVAGQAAARAAQAQWEEEQRLKLEERRIEAARQQNKAQLDALTQYRLSELGLGKERLGEERARTTELGRHNLMEEALGSRRVDESIQRLKEAQTRGEESLDLRRQMLEMQRQRAEDAAARPRTPHYFTGPHNVQYMVEPGSTNAVPISIPNPKAKPAEPQGFGAMPLPDMGSLLTGPIGGATSPFGPSTPSQSSQYKVGGRYGKLIYKGGDPNEESSWENAE